MIVRLRALPLLKVEAAACLRTYALG